MKSSGINGLWHTFDDGVIIDGDQSAKASRNWPGRIFIVFGAYVPATPPAKREAMQRCYPQVGVRVIEGAEHGIAVSHREVYYATVDAFLAR